MTERSIDITKLSYVLFMENGTHVGHCLDLDVVSHGDTHADALRMTMEAAQIAVDADEKEGLDPLERRAPRELWPKDLYDEGQ